MSRRLLLATLMTLAACGQEPGTDASEGRAAAPANSFTSAAADPEQAAVLAVIQGLFDALATGDEALLRSVTVETLVMHSTERRADGTTSFGSSTVDGLAARITGSVTPLIERMWDPEVSISGAIANVWTPYDFYSGTTFSHCGTDAATLLRTEAGWKIVALSWTRAQPPTCPLHPEGPPIA